MDKEDKEFFIELLKERPQSNAVSKKIESPVFWLSLLGMVLMFTGSIALTFYKNTQDAQNNSIVSNTLKAEENAESTRQLFGLLKEMQHEQSNQGRISERLLEEVKDLRRSENDILSTRFEDKDFLVHIQPFDNRLSNIEKLAEQRTDTVADVEDMKDTIVDIGARLKIIEARQDMRSEK